MRHSISAFAQSLAVVEKQGAAFVVLLLASEFERFKLGLVPFVEVDEGA